MCVCSNVPFVSIAVVANPGGVDQSQAPSVALRLAHLHPLNRIESIIETSTKGVVEGALSNSRIAEKKQRTLEGLSIVSGALKT